MKELLLAVLQESYDKFAWHGPNLTQALDGVLAAQASWRPTSHGAVRWNIREITLHVAAVMQRCSADLSGNSGDRSFRLVDENEFPLPNLTSEEQWAAELDLLQRSYELLQRDLSAMPPSTLEEVSPSSAYRRRWTFANQVYGVALHNAYHAAQIVSLRRRQGVWTVHGS